MTENNGIDNKNLSSVLYSPGQEPEAIQIRLRRLFEKLDSAYPDKVISGLNKKHKSWGEAVTELYRELGYPDSHTFLETYGYTFNTVAAPRFDAVDPVAAIAKLKELYPEGTELTIGELKNNHPDIQWKSLQNKSDEYFGMSFSKYLIKEGILLERKKVTHDENKEPKKTKLTDEEKLAAIEKTLAERYAGIQNLPTSVTQIKRENKDLHLSEIEVLVKRVKKTSAKNLFTELGVIAMEETSEDKLYKIITELKRRYIGTDRKAYYIYDLIEQNPDLPIRSLQKLINELYNKNQTEYLLERGILSEPEVMKAARIAREREMAREFEEKKREERFATGEINKSERKDNLSDDENTPDMKRSKYIKMKTMLLDTWEIFRENWDEISERSGGFEWFGCDLGSPRVKNPGDEDFLKELDPEVYSCYCKYGANIFRGNVKDNIMSVYIETEKKTVALCFIYALKLIDFPDFRVKLRIYRDKYEFNGDYDGMGEDGSHSVYWTLDNRYEYGFLYPKGNPYKTSRALDRYYERELLKIQGNNKTSSKDSSDKTGESDEKQKNKNEQQRIATISGNALEGAVCCLTGDFKYGEKSDVEEYIRSLGGTCSSSVTRKTNKLIIGALGSTNYSHGTYGKKYLAAVEKQDKGEEMEILTEEEFFEKYR